MTPQKPPCAPIFRWWRGFGVDDVQRRLAHLPHCPSSGPASDEAAATDPAWHHYYSEAVIAREAPGPPVVGAAFERARVAITNYEFSDPNAVRAYFERNLPLEGRPMLLEIQVLGLHVLCGVVVRAVREEHTPEGTIWGFRYDTLVGHVESGAEWFLLSKDHATGEVRFRIQATWKKGTLPTWWARLGFEAVASTYQRAWHRSAYVRLRALLDSHDLPDLPRGRAILKPWQPALTAVHEFES